MHKLTDFKKDILWFDHELKIHCKMSECCVRQNKERTNFFSQVSSIQLNITVSPWRTNYEKNLSKPKATERSCKRPLAFRYITAQLNNLNDGHAGMLSFITILTLIKSYIMLFRSFIVHWSWSNMSHESVSKTGFNWS